MTPRRNQAQAPPADDQREQHTTAFGRRLVSRRTRRKLSLRDLAELTGIPRATLQRLETKMTQPSLDTALKLAVTLGFSLDALAGGLNED